MLTALVGQEEYRLAAMELREDWNEQDQRWFREWLPSKQGMRFMRLLFLREQAMMMDVGKCDFTTEQGRMEALRIQGESRGFTAAIGALFMLLEDK